MESNVTAPLQTAFVAVDAGEIAGIEGRIAVFADGTDTLDPLARQVNRLSKGAVARLVGSDAFGKAKAGSGHLLAHPAGLAAEAVQVVKLPKRPSPAEARLAGAAIAGFNTAVPLTVLGGNQARIAEVAQGLDLKSYAFNDYRTRKEDAPEPNRAVRFVVRNPEAAEAAF